MMRLQDRNAQSDEEIEVRGHTVRVLVWIEPEEERYEDVYGKPGSGDWVPDENTEFWWVRAEARLDDFTGDDSLGFLATDGSREAQKYFEEQVEEIKQNAIAELFKNIGAVAKGGEKFGYQARRGAARGITSKLRGNARRSRGPSYADWVHAVNEECLRRGIRFDDYNVSWWRQLFSAGQTPAEAVTETLQPVETDVYEPNRSWSSREKHALPPSSFLYHHGDVRKLPFKDAQGRISCSHLRNALARLSHTDIPERAKATIRRRAEDLLARHCGR